MNGPICKNGTRFSEKGKIKISAASFWGSKLSSSSILRLCARIPRTGGMWCFLHWAGGRMKQSKLSRNESQDTECMEKQSLPRLDTGNTSHLCYIYVIMSW